MPKESPATAAVLDPLFHVVNLQVALNKE